MMIRIRSVSFFFFNDTATTEIYTLSLHDALPIGDRRLLHPRASLHVHERQGIGPADQDRLAADRAGRKDLRAHATRPRLRGHVLDEARVDGRRPAALRD